MGPGSIFELLRGELVDIVDYAIDHHKKMGRPPRLAVNASSWWYANMTAATVQSVRDRIGVHANPIERNILFYTLRILQLGIQLHFVFDGPRRLSNGGKLYPGHDFPSLLFQETLTQVGVPWHEAPAEAEAECAKMEMEKLVDGVWSEDGDALAFGCQTLIKFHLEIRSSTERSEETRKSSTYFKVYKLGDISTQYLGMDREGFIFHAILNGRPSDIGELYNLRPQDVLNAAQLGLGRSLCAAAGSMETLRQWASAEMGGYLENAGRNLEIPPEFPIWEHVQDYLAPVVSNQEVLLNLPQPQDPFMDEKRLYSFLIDKFQWTKKQWVKFVVPIRIVRSLLATEEGEESQHDFLKLECDQKKKSPTKKSPQKTKAKFLLSKATSLDVSDLHQAKGEIETLPWILRKANFNEQRSITSYLISTPKPNEKGKAVAPASIPSNSFQRSELLTPPSSSMSSSNGEGPSTKRNRLRRQSTPPSPTPAIRKRKPAWPKGAAVTKNIRSAPKNNGTFVETNASGKSKGKEVLNSSKSNRKRARSPTDSSSSSDAFKEINNKRPRLAAEPLPSTPPSHIIKPAEPDQGFKVIDSDSDEDDYGSLLSTADLPSTLFEDIAAKSIGDGEQAESSSGDEYGSFPASPDLRAVI